MPGNVSLVTSTILFNPIREDPRAYKVVVGTPTGTSSWGIQIIDVDSLLDRVNLNILAFSTPSFFFFFRL